MKYIGLGSLLVYQVTETAIGEEVIPPPTHPHYLANIGRHNWIPEKIAWEGGKVAILWKAEILTTRQFKDWPDKTQLEDGSWSA